ncbi:MAG: hypothetical protein QM692_18740 [Thermomicrobiales bacterium]
MAGGVGRVSRRASGVTVLLVMLVFAFSLWSSLWQPSGVAMVAWALGWALAAGRVAWRWPGFRWPGLCAAAMLLVWLPWTLRYGQTAWQSMYVVMLAVSYAVAAAAGIAVGNLLRAVRRRRAEAAPAD